MAFDIVVFNRWVYLVMTETVAQQVQLFNAASAGAITLISTSENVGDFTMRASFKQIANLVRRRDVYNGSTAVAAARLQQLQNNSVKVPSGTPPIIFEAAQYAWVQQNPEQASIVIGEQLAVAMMQDMLNTAITGAVAAISSQASVSHAAAGVLTFGDLVQGAGKFGDRMARVAAWVMHSKSLTDLFGEAVNNNNNLFVYDTISVVADPFGRRFVMTDSDGLVNGAKYKTLGLVSGAVMVEQNSDFRSNIETTNGTENIQDSYQAEWSYNLGLLGYSWNMTTGGKAPTNAAIGTAASWERTATDIKDTAGVMITSD